MKLSVHGSRTLTNGRAQIIFPEIKLDFPEVNLDDLLKDI